MCDHASARRFLVFFLYLNNNYGRQTSFEEYNTVVQPERGKTINVSIMFDFIQDIIFK